MSRIIVLGAAGSLGKHVAEQALAAGHEVSVVVRTPAKLPPAWRERVRVHEADLAEMPPTELGTLAATHDALVNTAGYVADGEEFVVLVARVVAAIEAIEPARRPVSWFIAGAGVLDIGDTGRRGVDLPVISRKFWPHAENFARLQASALDWRLLCPGPMVEGPGIGLERLRMATDRLPVAIPALARRLPAALLVPLFASRIPEMIVSYADAAALMLANLAPGGPLSRRRVGLALPPGMRGHKDGWVAHAPRG